MPRAPRIDKGNLVYHIINRANGRQQIFHTEGNYLLFERTLEESSIGNRYGIGTDTTMWDFYLNVIPHIECGSTESDICAKLSLWRINGKLRLMNL